MNIVKREKSKNYTTISNVFLRDKNLSIKAKGLLAVVMSLPEDWDFTINGICSVLKEGKTAIYSAIQELKDCGYCNVDICRNEKGIITGNDYTFREFPNEGNPYSEEPHSDFRHTENQTQIIKEETNNGNDKIKKIEKEDKSSSKKTYDLSFVDGKYMSTFTEWLEYKSERKEKYKTESSLKACYNRLLKLSGDNPQIAAEIVQQSIANNYAGLFEYKEMRAQNPKPKTQEEINREKLNMPILNDDGDLPDGTFFKNGKRWYFSKQEGRAASCAPDASPRPNDRAEYDWAIKDWRVPRDKWEASDEIW